MTRPFTSMVDCGGVARTLRYQAAVGPHPRGDGVGAGVRVVLDYFEDHLPVFAGDATGVMQQQEAVAEQPTDVPCTPRSGLDRAVCSAEGGRTCLTIFTLRVPLSVELIIMQ